jgi:hypothetical protein
MASGAVSVDAEHYFATSQNGSSHYWGLVSGVSAASGNQCMETPEWSYTWGNTGYNPRIDFKVNLNTTGQFYLHVKAEGASGTADTCFVGINDTANASYIDINTTNYGWTTFNLGNISTSGVKTINFWPRTDGFRLDKFVISTSATTPTGTGPAESALN